MLKGIDPLLNPELLHALAAMGPAKQKGSQMISSGSQLRANSTSPAIIGTLLSRCQPRTASAIAELVGPLPLRSGPAEPAFSPLMSHGPLSLAYQT